MTDKEIQNIEEWTCRALDGELNQDELDRVQRMMARDPAAAALRQAWAAQGDLLRNLPEATGPDPQLVWQHVRDEISAAEVKAPIRFPTAWVAAAAAALILAFGGWQLMTGSPAVPPVVQAGPANVVEYVEAELPNHSHFSWTDESSGATVIWVDEWTDEGEEAGG